MATTEELSQMSPKEIAKKVNELLSPHGFECHNFKVGWYNDAVGSQFVLPYEYDTLAILVISTPDLFEKSLVPFIMRTECPGSGDMLDECLKEHFNNVKMDFSDCEVEAIHDFELLPSRRPKVLVQTAGHVSGAAYYYQRNDCHSDTWEEKTKIYGVSIHPTYGGWFALRGVLIFKNVVWPELEKVPPIDAVPTQEKRKELLERFNFNWRDWTFRDIVPTEKKYSEDQRLYFSMQPKERADLIERLKQGPKCSDTVTESCQSEPS